MKLSDADRARIESFRTRLERKLQTDERFGELSRDDREDGTYLATRFAVADKLYIEFAVRPNVPQLRAGVMTDDRWTSEDLEQVIEDSGDTMPEFVELGFEDAGLEWPEPQVEHYRDRGKYFYFATAFEPASLAALEDAATVDKLERMCIGYYEAFRAAIKRAEPAE